MPNKQKPPAKSKSAAKAPNVDPFVLSRVFDAPRDMVVRAWTEREHLMHWWGPKGVTRLPGKLDLRPGGIFHYALQNSDGSVMWGKWEILEVDLPDRLVWNSAFSDTMGGTTRHPMVPDWPAKLLTTVTFADEPGGKTKVTVRWDVVDATATEAEAFDKMHPSMNQGWGGSFDELAAHLPQMVREAAQKVTPHLTIHDAAKAIDWYKSVLGAEERMRMPAKDGKRIMHCDLALNGGTLLLNDEFPDHDGPSGPHKGSMSPVAIALDVAPASKVDALYKRAVEAGAKGTMPPEDTFWNARFAMFTDPFGHRWMLNGNKPAA